MEHQCKCGLRPNYYFGLPDRHIQKGDLCVNCLDIAVKKLPRIYMITTPLWPMVFVSVAAIPLGDILDYHKSSCGYPLLLAGATRKDANELLVRFYAKAINLVGISKLAGSSPAMNVLYYESTAALADLVSLFNEIVGRCIKTTNMVDVITMNKPMGRICPTCCEQPIENFNRPTRPCAFCADDGQQLRQNNLDVHGLPNKIIRGGHIIVIFSDQRESLYYVTTGHLDSLIGLGMHVHFALSVSPHYIYRIFQEFEQRRPVELWHKYPLNAHAGPISELVSAMADSYNAALNANVKAANVLYVARVTRWSVFKVGVDTASGVTKLQDELLDLYDTAEITTIPMTAAKMAAEIFYETVGSTHLIHIQLAKLRELLAAAIVRLSGTMPNFNAAPVAAEFDGRRLCKKCRKTANTLDVGPDGICCWCIDGGEAALHATMQQARMSSNPGIGDTLYIFQLGDTDLYGIACNPQLDEYIMNGISPRIIFKLVTTRSYEILEELRTEMNVPVETVRSIMIVNCARSTILKAAIKQCNFVNDRSFLVVPRIFCNCGWVSSWYNFASDSGKCLHCMYKSIPAIRKGIIIIGSHWNRIMIAEIGNLPDRLMYVYSQLLCQPLMHFYYSAIGTISPAIAKIRNIMAEYRIGTTDAYNVPLGTSANVFIKNMVEIISNVEGKHWNDLADRSIIAHRPGIMLNAESAPANTVCCTDCHQDWPPQLMVDNHQCCWCYDLGTNLRQNMRRHYKLDSMDVAKITDEKGYLTKESGVYMLFIAAPGAIDYDKPTILRIGATYCTEYIMAELCRQLWGSSSMYFAYYTRDSEKIMKKFDTQISPNMTIVGGIKFNAGLYNTTISAAINLFVDIIEQYRI